MVGEEECRVFWDRSVCELQQEGFDCSPKWLKEGVGPEDLEHISFQRARSLAGCQCGEKHFHSSLGVLYYLLKILNPDI